MPIPWLSAHFIFSCGRRPAGLLVIPVVVAVVGGGITFMHGFEKIKSKTTYFSFFLFSFFQKPMYGLDAHVWSRRGVTPHSEIIV